VLCVLCVCVLGVVWSISDSVGSVAVVTDGDGPTLYPWGTPSEIGGSSNL
jgi:hypothetical protein